MTDRGRRLDFGPEWLRRELPQPIASAWHRAVEYPGGDYATVAIAVEVALRFVTALQVANLLAEERELPEAVTSGLKSPNLAPFIDAVRKAREALRGHAFLPELSTWPDKEVEALLDQFRPFRNQLSHEPMKPTERKELGGQTLEAAVKILSSLDWLRRVELVSFVDIWPARESLREGKVQVLRSHDDEPRSERRAWRGDPRTGRFYLRSSDPHEPRLLDLAPFIRRSTVDGDEEIQLWLGLQDHRVRFLDKNRKGYDQVALRDVHGDPRFVPCEWVPQGVDPAGPTQPEAEYGPMLREAGLAQRRGQRVVAWLGALAFVGACVAAVAVVSGADTERAPGGASVEATGAREVTPRAVEAAVVVDGARPEEGGATARPSENPFAEHPFLPEFVDRFCRGEASEDDLAMLDMLAKNRAVSVRALIAVFNVYGAFYRYEFKSELWLNDLYYGAGAVHLPESCRAMIGAYRTEGEVPGHLERVRDRVKQIWRAVK